MNVTPGSDDALIAHFERVHHGFLRCEIPALHALCRRVSESHALGAVLEVFEDLADELLGLACKEQNVLYPMLQSLSPGVVHPIWRKREIGHVMRVIRAERTRVRARFARLRGLTADYAPDASCHHRDALMARLGYFERVVLDQMSEEEELLESGLVDQGTANRLS